MESHRLSKHLRDLTQFSCPSCNSTFSRKGERLAHVLLRQCQKSKFRVTSLGPMCDYCGQLVSSKKHRCRSMEKRCPVCQQDFKGQRQHAIVSHFRKKHPEEAKELE